MSRLAWLVSYLGLRNPVGPVNLREVSPMWADQLAHTLGEAGHARIWKLNGAQLRRIQRMRELYGYSAS
jgi:hypothetical protein